MSENTIDDKIGLGEQKYLIEIARKSIEVFLENEEVLDVEPRFDKLKERKGTFVTLEKHGELRGCIGNIQPGREIYLSVRDNAINAAFRDPRFPPLQKEELDEVEIEISIHLIIVLIIILIVVIKWVQWVLERSRY